MSIKEDLVIILIVVSIPLIIIAELFWNLQVEHALIICFLIALIFTLVYSDRNAKDYIETILLGTGILFAIVFVVALICCPIVHFVTYHDEIDQPGSHTATINITNVEDSTHIISYEHKGKMIYWDKTYDLIDSSGRKFHVLGACYDDLKNAYNNSVIGHNVTISFDSNNGVYNVCNMTTESGEFIE